LYYKSDRFMVGLKAFKPRAGRSFAPLGKTRIVD
jgi:hypothetical protein